MYAYLTPENQFNELYFDENGQLTHSGYFKDKGTWYTVTVNDDEFFSNHLSILSALSAFHAACEKVKDGAFECADISERDQYMTYDYMSYTKPVSGENDA